MNIFSLFIWNVRIDQICIKRIPGYSTFPSTFGLWCHCGQILTSILSGWLTYCMTDNCSSLQRQTSTVYEFSKEEASLTVRKVKPFVTAALATSGVCTVKQPAAAAVMSTFQKDCDFLKFSLIKLFMQWVELSETLPFYSEPRVARLFTLFFFVTNCAFALHFVKFSLYLVGGFKVTIVYSRVASILWIWMAKFTTR